MENNINIIQTLIAATFNSVDAERRKVEDNLKLLREKPLFFPLLLQIIAKPDVDINIKKVFYYI